LINGDPNAVAAVAIADQIARATDGVTQRSSDEASQTGVAPARSTPPAAKPAATTVTISRSRSPAAAAHLERSGATGRTLTIDRAGAAARRQAALRGVPTSKGSDRDESPPAVFSEGSTSVQSIPSSDNRSAGGQLGQQIKNLPDGCKVNITICK
jgi:hypothetical protein